MAGIFITLEGTDGAGKSTQLNLLAEYLKNIGRNVLITREPGGTPIGEEIRSMILSTANSEMTHETEALLYAAARAQHVAQIIKPALDAGKIVISDRYLDSSIAYQGYARGLGRETIEAINAFATNLSPNLTLYFNLTPADGFKRKINDVPDRLEAERITFHNAVYNGYAELSKIYSHRIKCINASNNEQTVFEEVKLHIDALLNI